MRRDSFARTEIKRTLIKQPIAGGCSWCGARPEKQLRTLGAHSWPTRTRLYMYATVTDGGTRNPHKGQFCNLSCHDAYHS